MILPVTIFNADSQDMPGFGVGVAYDASGADSGALGVNITRMTQAHFNARSYIPIINGPRPIRRNQTGTGFIAFGKVRALYTVNSASGNKVYGLFPGSWQLEIGGGGFFFVGNTGEASTGLFMFDSLPKSYVVRPSANISPGSSGVCRIQQRSTSSWSDSSPLRTITAINHSSSRVVVGNALCQMKFEDNTGQPVIDVEECAE